MTMQLDLMSLHGTVKNSQNDQFYATYILSQFKKKHEKIIFDCDLCIFTSYLGDTLDTSKVLKISS